MNKSLLLKKVENGEGLTVSEIKEYQKITKSIEHTYGKYGTLAKIYIEEHNTAKLWGLAGGLPEYCHNIDKQADDMYESMYKKLSNHPHYRKSGDFMKDLAIETEIRKLIDEEILNELVYVK